MLKIRNTLATWILALSCSTTQIQSSHLTAAESPGLFTTVYNFITTKCREALCIIRGDYYSLPSIDTNPAPEITPSAKPIGKPKRKKKKKAKKVKSIEALHADGSVDILNIEKLNPPQPIAVITRNSIDTIQNLAYDAIANSITEDEDGFQVVVSKKKNYDSIHAIEKLLISEIDIRDRGVFRSGQSYDIGDKKYLVSIVNNEGSDRPSQNARFTISFIEEEAAEYIPEKTIIIDGKKIITRAHVNILDKTKPHISVSLENFKNNKFHITTKLAEATRHFYFYLSTALPDHRTISEIEELKAINYDEGKRLERELKKLASDFSKIARFRCH